MNATEIKKLKDSIMSTFNRMKDKGRMFTTWECPECKKDNECPVPNHVETRGYADGAKVCYECGEVSWVKVYADGETNVVTLN